MNVSKALALACFGLLSGCAAMDPTAGSNKPSVEETWTRQEQLIRQSEQRRATAPQPLDPNEPITIDFVRKDALVVRHLLGRDEFRVGNTHVVMHLATSGSGNWSYNPELRSMGFRIGSDGQPKRFAGDGEVRSSWDELRAAQGFER